MNKERIIEILHLMLPFFLIIALLVSMNYLISQKKYTCKDGELYKIIDKKFWKGTGISCKQISGEGIER